MKQTSFESELRQLELRANRELEEVRKKLEKRIVELERPTPALANYGASPNYLRNSHAEWSTDAYTNSGITPTTAGDLNREAFGWYRQKGVYDGTPTTLLTASSTYALKREYTGAQHTLWAANEGADSDIPIWDGENGTFLLGGSTDNYDIACPLPTDFAVPGQRFYVYLEVSLASDTIDKGEGQQFYCGFWDNTTGQEKWLEGSDFTLSGSVFGASGSRTLEYKVLAETDSGTQIISDTLSITTAPATLSELNHVRLSFTGAPGFIYYGVYRKDGSTYRLVQEIRNSNDLAFYDMQESGGAIVDGFPTLSAQRPQAFAITTAFEPGELSSSAFAVHTLTVQVPLTYDASNTTAGNQWFRFGLDSNVGIGSERGIVIRRIAVSEGFGAWTRSPLDLQAASSPTSRPASGPPTGNPTGDPSGAGGGGINCVTLDTQVEAMFERADGEKVLPITAEDIQAGDYVWAGALSLPVKRTKTGTVQRLFVIVTENGKRLECSTTHRIITSSKDRHGKAAKDLCEGDLVMTWHNGQFVQSAIKTITEKWGSFVVKSITLPTPHLWITNGVVSHNRKDPI